MSTIKEVFLDIGPLNWVTSKSYEFPSTTTSRIITLVLPLFYLYESGALLVTALTRGIFEIGKNIVKIPFATLQALIPSLHFFDTGSVTIKIAEGMLTYRKYLALIIGGAVIAAAISCVALAILGQLPLLIELVPFIVTGLGIALKLLLAQEIILNTFIYHVALTESFEKHKVFENLAKLPLLLIHSLPSPFLSQDYQVKKGFIMPKPNTYDNVGIIFNKCSPVVANYLLRTEVLNKESLKEFTEGPISDNFFFKYFPKLKLTLSPDEYDKFMVLNEGTIKNSVTENLVYFTAWSIYESPLDLDQIFPFVDKDSFLSTKQQLPWNLGRIIDALEEINRRLKLGPADMVKFFEKNFNKLNNTLHRSLNCNYQILHDLKPKTHTPLLGLFRIQMGLLSGKIFHPNHYFTKEIKTESSKLISDLKDLASKNSTKSTNYTKGYVKEMFEQRGTLLNTVAFDCLLSLIKKRETAVSGAFDEMIKNHPQLREYFDEIFLYNTKNNENFKLFGNHRSDITLYLKPRID